MEDFAGGAVEFSEPRRLDDSRRANPAVGADREGNPDRALLVTGASRIGIEAMRLDLCDQQRGVIRTRPSDVDGLPICLADMMGFR
jgi:hypothetical protein